MAILFYIFRYINVFKKSISILITVLSLVSFKARAQYDVAFSHYFDMEPSFNAASVGKQSKLNITAAYALSMAGYEHNPQTLYAAADMPFFFLNNYHGAGVQFMNDKLGLFTHQRVAVQYAYKHKLFGGQFSAGIQMGLLSESFKGSEVDVENTSDPALSTSDVDGNSVDMGLGLYYVKGAWYAGASVQHLNSPVIDLGETNELKIDATYYLTGGYNINLRNPFLTIKPSFLIRSDAVDTRVDVTARLQYTYEKKMMYGGVGYSPTNSVTFMFGGVFHGIVLGYSYEIYTSGINPENGSHEFFLGYQVDVNLAKKGKNKHKSVRIL